MIGDIAAIATAVGVAIVLVQIEAQRRQRRAQFEEDFTKRYWTILDGLSLAVQRGADTATDADRVQAHAYFRLSDEQIFQSLKERRVSRHAWIMWASGIRVTMERAPFLQEWKELDEEMKHIHFGDFLCFLASSDPSRVQYGSWTAWVHTRDSRA